MTNSRCANPSYAEDVDTMMVEYTAYNAIVSQLKLLRAFADTQYPRIANGLCAVVEPAENAARLSEIYEVLINLYRINHGIDSLSEAARLDGTLLKLLTLLNIWIRYHCSGLQGTIFHVGPSMTTALKQEQIVNRFLRQRWLYTRRDSNVAKPMVRGEVRNEVAQSQREGEALPTFQDHIVPCFMHVSRLMSPSAAEMSEKFIFLASRIMIQAAIEVIDSPDLLRAGIKAARQSVEQCFAWGYVSRNRYGSDSPLRRRLLAEVQGTESEPVEGILECMAMINDALIREDDCLQMFCDGGVSEDSMDVDGGSSLKELHNWSDVRQEALEIVLPIFDAVVDEGVVDKLAPIQWLKDRYRLSLLLEDLAKFLNRAWSLYRSPGWHGEPILIQIEKGGIQGLSEEEFALFKQRARIA